MRTDSCQLGAQGDPPRTSTSADLCIFLPVFPPYNLGFPESLCFTGDATGWKVVPRMETLFLLKEVEPEVGMWSSSVGHPQARLLASSSSTHRMVELPPSCGLSMSQALP